MSYFPDLCALTPEILREHSLPFPSYLALFRLSGQSSRCRPVTRNCIVLTPALKLIPCLVSIIWLFPASWPLSRLVTEITSDYRDPAPPGGRITCQCRSRAELFTNKTKFPRRRWLRDSWQRLVTSWAPSQSQKGNSFLSCLPSYIWLALSNLTLSVRKSISYFDQILILGTKYWPADIDDINIDEDGEIRKQSHSFYILGKLLIFSNVHLCSWCYFNFLKNDHMYIHIIFIVSEAIYLSFTIE